MLGNRKEISLLNIGVMATHTKEWSGHVVAWLTSRHAQRAGGEYLTTERQDAGKGGLFLEQGRWRPKICNKEQWLG